MMIDASHSGQQVALQVGQAAELRLPENRTTGFRWFVVSDGGPACRLDDNGFQGRDEAASMFGNSSASAPAPANCGSLIVEVLPPRRRPRQPSLCTCRSNRGRSRRTASVHPSFICRR